MEYLLLKIIDRDIFRFRIFFLIEDMKGFKNFIFKNLRLFFMFPKFMS